MPSSSRPTERATLGGGCFWCVEAADKFSDPIVTEIVPLTKFYPAELRHQDYFRRNPQAPCCTVVINPKLQ